MYSYVSRLRQNGAAPEEIQQKLIEAGVGPQEASALVDRLLAHEATQEIHTRAARLLREGVPAAELQARLVAEGFGAELVDPVVKDLLEERAREQKDREETPGPILRVFGAVLVVLGVGLLIGNRTGVFPTFPFAGAITMGIGALIFAIGQYRASSD